MRTRRASSCACWRPDPRDSAGPERAVLYRARAPGMETAAPLPLLDASRLRCGSACHRTHASARNSADQVGTAERVHGDVVAALVRCQSYPQFRCTNVTWSCVQTVAVNSTYPPAASPPCLDRLATLTRVQPALRQPPGSAHRAHPDRTHPHPTRSELIDAPIPLTLK